MKHTFLYSIIISVFVELVSTMPANSQGFGSNQPVWHYERYTSIWGGVLTYETVAVEGDTIIKGHNCRVFVTTPECWGDVYMYDSAEVVYRYFSDSGVFDTLFFMGAQPGDSWNYREYSGTKSKIFVDSLGVVMVNGTLLKTIHIHFDNNPFSGRIIYERIGWLYHFDILQAVADPPCKENLRCYTDTFLGTARMHDPPFNKNITAVCDTVIDLAVTEPKVDKFAIYPNPTSGIFELKTGNGSPRSICIHNIRGEILTLFPSDQRFYDISGLEHGIYMAEVETEDGIYWIRIVKI